MLTITECKKILNKNGQNYSNDEVEKIMKLLYFLAELSVRNELK
jgi:hypothetical protein